MPARSSQTRTIKERSANWLLLAGGVIGPPLFTIIFLIEGLTRPSYSAWYQSISALSLSDQGWIQIANFIVCGLLILCFAVGLRQMLYGGKGGTWGPILIAVVGVGLVVAGIFVIDPARGYPPGTPAGPAIHTTLPGSIHFFFGTIAFFVVLPASCLVLSRRFADEIDWKGWATYSTVTGILMAAFFVAFAILGMRVGFAGLLERISIIIGMSWIMLLAARLLYFNRELISWKLVIFITTVIVAVAITIIWILSAQNKISSSWAIILSASVTVLGVVVALWPLIFPPDKSEQIRLGGHLWWIPGSIAACFVVFEIVFFSYRFNWIGVSFSNKTFGDWIQLVIVPVSLILVVLLFNLTITRKRQGNTEKPYQITRLQYNGFFDKHFVIAYLSPIFSGLVIMIGIILVLSGPVMAENWWNNWNKLNVTGLVLIVGGVLLLITLLAFVLEMLSEPISRLYQGYWPRVLMPFSRLLISKQRRILERELNTVSRQPSLEFLQHAVQLENIRPTMLGNILAAAEEHAFQLYRLDARIWWTRLTPLLPETYRKQMDTALAPMQAMLNLSMIFTLIVGGGGGIALEFHNWLLFATIFIVGLLIARMCYIMAMNQAENYGSMVQVAYDFYRKEILKQMNIPIPDNLLEERLLWDALNIMMNHTVLPWEEKLIPIPSLVQKPFYYDTHKKELEKE